MDKYGNLVEKGEVVDLVLEGLKFCDRKGGFIRKVYWLIIVFKLLSNWNDFLLVYVIYFFLFMVVGGYR